MQPDPPPLQGEAVMDERQLDGARHLTLDFAAAAGDWSVALHLVMDRDGAPREGELEIEGAGGVWSGALVRVEAVETAGPLRLRASFRADDPAVPERVIDLREDAEGDGFRLRVG